MSSTVYATPDEWGSTTVYADVDGMLKVIASLIDAGGEDWSECSLSDCAQWELVQTINGVELYQERNVRRDSYMALKLGENGEYEEVYFSGMFGRRIAAYNSLEDAIEELSA